MVFRLPGVCHEGGTVGGDHLAAPYPAIRPSARVLALEHRPAAMTKEPIDRRTSRKTKMQAPLGTNGGPVHLDLTFITNEAGTHLSDRFAALLGEDTRFFDCLVGYFFLSGFHRIHPALTETEKIRILGWGSPCDRHESRPKW